MWLDNRIGKIVTWVSQKAPILLEIKDAVAYSFAPQDPKRFATTGATPWNWNGEYEGKIETKGGAILVNKTTQTFEFGQYSNIKIEPYLTALDIQELRARKLNPDNPAYSKCKEYFAANPFCNEKDMAPMSAGDQSQGEYFAGVSINTCEKVLAAFRAYIEDKPTF